MQLIKIIIMKRVKTQNWNGKYENVKTIFVIQNKWASRLSIAHNLSSTLINWICGLSAIQAILSMI